MFHSVGHPGHALLIAEVSDMNVEGSASLVSLKVMNKQSLESVLQTDNAVITIV